LTDFDTDYDDDAILRLLNESLRDRFTHPLITARAGYWRQKALLSVEAGQPNYRIPYRAVDGIVEMVEIRDSEGSNFRSLVFQTQGRVYRYQGAGTPRVYAIDGDSINIRPTPSSSGATLRVTYFVTPPTLVAAQPDDVEPFGINNTPGYVNSVDTSTYEITLAALPTVETEAGPPVVNAGDLYAGCAIDIIRPNGTFELSLVQTLVDTVVGTVITVPVGTDLSRVQEGDRVRQAGTSDWPQLPLGLHQALVDYTVAVILIQKGDVERAKYFAQKADNAVDRVVDVMVPRAKAQPPSITPRFSFLRRGNRRY